MSFSKDYIVAPITESLRLKRELLESSETIETIEHIVTMVCYALRSGGKVLFCGNGGSASDSQHLAAEFVGRFQTKRSALGAIALTTDTSILTAVGNDFGFDAIFERQVEALANSGDILIALSTSGNSQNIARALKMAKQKGAHTVGLLGGSGGACLELCQESVVINSKEAARVQELHILVGHIICGGVEAKLLSENNSDE